MDLLPRIEIDGASKTIGNSVVLDQIQLTVKPGEMIGIVGASGTGKSTLINLIMRLYEVDDGAILVDGTDIKKVRSEKYHAQLGVVLQLSLIHISEPTRH